MVEAHQRETVLDVESPMHGFQGNRGPLSALVDIPAGVTIAISRESGARGGTIGRRVGRTLGWQVYDQELLEFVLQDARAQQEIFDSLSEPANRWVDTQLAEMVGRQHFEKQPAMIDLVRLGLSIGAQGNAVLVGRGAGFLLPRASTLHVRLVAPLEDRIAYMSQCFRLTLEEARQRVQVRDTLRADFLTNYLGIQAGDGYQYDMVLNTSSLGEELSADLIVRAARQRTEVLRTRPDPSPAA